MSTALLAGNIAAALILVSILTAVMLVPFRLPEPQPDEVKRRSRERLERHGAPAATRGGHRPSMRPVEDF